MKVVGIIAEYNPFHKGHEYQIHKIKEQTNADYIIIAMSGNFVQRGEPALLDKFSRAQMALSCGVDLVLELPTLWACASAEYFARGAISLLQNTGVVTHLGFGAETADLDSLVRLSSILREEPISYQHTLNAALRKGNSFPIARKEALLAALATYNTAPCSDHSDIAALLDTPNNILALEYLKALDDSISPILIQRTGSGYHDKNMNNPYPSASAIRKMMHDAKDQFADVQEFLSAALPMNAYHILSQELKTEAYCFPEDLSLLLGYRLLSLYRDSGYSKACYAQFADCNIELSNRIANQLNLYKDFDSFCLELKSKEVTYTRIRRILLHILLNIKQEDYRQGIAVGYSPYLRVLGFRKAAAPLLHGIKSHGCAPLITKVADANALLSSDAYRILEHDLYATALYGQFQTICHKQSCCNDYTHPIVIL